MDFHSFLKTYQKREVRTYKNTVPDNPLVSICVQTYNHEAYIAECLDGLLAQETTFSFEILLGEDASTDETRAICMTYAEKYPDKIKLFLHHRENNIKVHGNPTGRFNFLYNLYQSTGTYIAFCEGDDYWIDPLKLQKQIDFLEANQSCVVSWTNYKSFNGFDFVENQFNFEETNRIINFDTIFSPYCTLTLTVVFKKSALMISAINNFEYFKDNTLYAMLLQNGDGIFMNFIAAVYREHQGGVYALKSNYFKNYSSYLNIREIIELIPKARTKNMYKVLNSLGNAAAFGALKLKNKGEMLTDAQLKFMRTYFKHASLRTKFKYFKRQLLK
ncbi:glycosyltransferase [uncultured Psychroserpens sp.]|uniref:glycosyltransferase family 2 protein n=1 Tax=uncultured Psychroserpens sp. TaxID=255436 RepID=UPI00262FFE64|nr:glycosyltransferase [uncultured Psychroserpens sp.]